MIITEKDILTDVHDVGKWLNKKTVAWDILVYI